MFAPRTALKAIISTTPVPATALLVKSLMERGFVFAQPKNEVLDDSGNCTCIEAFTRLANGTCVENCPEDQTTDANGACTFSDCPEGEVRSSDAICLCAEGLRRAENGTCTELCPIGEVFSADGICDCTDGLNRAEDGTCQCPISQILNATGTCTCPQGQREYDGVCVDVGCEKGSRVDPDTGVCRPCWIGECKHCPGTNRCEISH